MIPVCSKEQLRSAKSMSVWEQRTNQLRKHNMRTSSEALFNELDPEERLQLASALHLHPDMMTHLDRPLVVEAKNGEKPCRSPDGGREETGEFKHDGMGENQTHSRRHHRHRERNGEGRDGGEGHGGRHHTHHSRSREHNGDRERRGDSSHSHDEGGQGHRHNHQAGSPEEDNKDFRGGEERGHRHHHSHRSPKEGNGVIANGAQGEHRGKGGGGGESNGERRGRCSRMVRAHSTLDGDDCKRNKNGFKGHR